MIVAALVKEAREAVAQMEDGEVSVYWPNWQSVGAVRVGLDGVTHIEVTESREGRCWVRVDFEDGRQRVYAPGGDAWEHMPIKRGSDERERQD